MRKLTTEEFIKKAKAIHGDKYDYSKSEYKGRKINICIICPVHGEFWQQPNNHLNGAGCHKCHFIKLSKSKSFNTETFVEKAKVIHGDKYDYSKVDYINAKTNICIICPEHGEFWQTPDMHLHGAGCHKCSKVYTPTTEEFIERAREIHGDKYDYSKVNYKNQSTKIIIICPIHGEFTQTPHGHLTGRGCAKCGISKVWEVRHKPTTEEFIERAREIHEDKYDYSKVDYKGNHIKVCIVCHEKDEEGNEHGEFWQKANNHINMKQGCPKCNGTHLSTTEEFIKKAKAIHGDKYDYSKVDYKDAHTKVCIICSEHGEFWQKPNNHLQGNGCPKCGISKLESELSIVMEKNNIKYDYQKKFKWLGRQSLDFYLPDYNIAIECQGGQHFFPVKWFGGEKGFKKILERDKRKKQLCEENNIKILYYGDKSLSNELLDSKELLLEINKLNI